jgi:hypothetical protein
MKKMSSLNDFGEFQRESQAHYVAWLENVALKVLTIMLCPSPSALSVKFFRGDADEWILVCFKAMRKWYMSTLAGRRG